MTGRAACPLCECEASDVNILAVVAEETLEGERPNIVRVKRALEATFNLELTVLQTKRHLGAAAGRMR